MAPNQVYRFGKVGKTIHVNPVIIMPNHIRVLYVIMVMTYGV
jgi:hypothetical protein